MFNPGGQRPQETRTQTSVLAVSQEPATVLCWR